MYVERSYRCLFEAMCLGLFQPLSPTIAIGFGSTTCDLYKKTEKNRKNRKKEK